MFDAVKDQERMQETIQTISHYAEIYHQGSIELVAFDGEHVQVKFKGACEGCPLLPHTLKMTVERTVLDLFPYVKSVTAV
jgi:Fe-S cluster biogenesis protein NfuA